MKKILLISFAATTFFITGCHAHVGSHRSHSHSYVEGHEPIIIIEEGHHRTHKRSYRSSTRQHRRKYQRHNRRQRTRRNHVHNIRCHHGRYAHDKP